MSLASLQLESQMSLQLISLLILFIGAAANFHEGDFIPSARRAQFGGVSIRLFAACA